MERILILGGFGFIGSNVIDYASRFLHDNYEFIVFDIYNDHPLGVQFENVIKIYKGDFNNREDIKLIFEENKIDYVFHFVSTTVPATSNYNIKYDIESNLISTIDLLELCAQYHIKCFLYMSSGGAVYGSSQNYIHSENDVLLPNSSYGIVKLTVEKYLKLYNHLQGLNYLCLRLANPYGIYHISQKQGLINIALKKAINGEKFQIWGDGTNIKDYIYAEDVAMIIFSLLKKKIVNQVLNVGSSKGYSINDVILMIKGLVPSFRIGYQSEKSFDVPKVILNTTKLLSYINVNLTPIEIGINNTYKWIQDQYTNQHSLL